MLQHVSSVSGLPEEPHPLFAADIVFLKDCEPVAHGAEQLVYVHPNNPDLLIKVARDRSRFKTPWYRKRTSRYGPFRPALREIEEYVALRASAPEDIGLVERAVGLVETDMGLGLAVEALRDRSGDLAPTLRKIMDRGDVTPSLRSELELFVARVLATDLIAYDMKPSNIVYAYDVDSGRERFVLVDGMGERLNLPFNKLSRRLNRFNKSRRARRLWAQLDGRQPNWH